MTHSAAISYTICSIFITFLDKLNHDTTGITQKEAFMTHSVVIIFFLHDMFNNHHISQ